MSNLNPLLQPVLSGATNAADKRIANNETVDLTLAPPADLVSSERQDSEHSVTLPTPMPSKTTEFSTPRTHSQREMEPTNIPLGPATDQVSTANGICSPVRHTLVNVMEGEIVWKFHLDSCAQEYSWTLITPEGYGFVVEFNHVEMLGEDSLAIICPAESLRRTFTQDGESLSPLLLDGTVIKIVFYDKYGSKNSWKSSNFNIRYTAHPKDSLPWLAYIVNDETLTESYFIYDCTGITDLPKAITCDGIRHCQHGEDEENCSYRTQGCGDWFPYRHLCLKATFALIHTFFI